MQRIEPVAVGDELHFHVPDSLLKQDPNLRRAFQSIDFLMEKRREGMQTLDELLQDQTQVLQEYLVRKGYIPADTVDVSGILQESKTGERRGVLFDESGQGHDYVSVWPGSVDSGFQA